MLLILETVIAFVLGLFALWAYRYWVCNEKNLPPGPYGLPIVGYLPFLDPKSPHKSLTKLSEKYGRIYSLKMGGILTVVLSDVKLVRQALALDDFSGRAPLYLTHGIMQGNGIICVQGEKWKDQRKFVVNCLRNFGMVKFGERRKKMEANIKVVIDKLIQKLKKTEDAVDLEPLLMHSLGNVVFRLVFGKEWDEDDETWKKLISLQEIGTKLIGIAGPINFLPWLRYVPKYKKIIEYIQDGIKYSHNIYQEILKDHQKSVRDRGEEKKEMEQKLSHFMGAFNEEMTKRKNEESFYTKTQFNFLMADLWGAGVDTTITTLRWFFLYLAHHQTFQRNIQNEMQEVLGEKHLTLEDIPSLPYLQACISEVQRIRSVTSLGIPHGTLQDSSLDGYYIPKGTMVMPLQWAIHMNPNCHQDPDVYDPSRFLDSFGNYKKLEAFIPFQTGKRMCLGEEYAKILLHLYCGTILQTFRISLESKADFEGEAGITLTPKPHKIIFRPIKNI